MMIVMISVHVVGLGLGEATYEHKAFTYWAPADLLAIPLSTYRYVYDSECELSL